MSSSMAGSLWTRTGLKHYEVLIGDQTPSRTIRNTKDCKVPVSQNPKVILYERIEYCSRCILEKPSSVGAMASMNCEGLRYLQESACTPFHTGVEAAIIFATHDSKLYRKSARSIGSLFPLALLLGEPFKSPPPSRQLVLGWLQARGKGTGGGFDRRSEARCQGFFRLRHGAALLFTV